MNSQKAKALAPVILRYALTLVFVWFGTNQLINASAWVRLVPEWATVFGMSAETVVHLNGMFEIIAAILLGAGVYVRLVASVLALHLFVITTHLGFTPVGVRDFGLSFATLSVALFGPDKYCFSYKEGEI